MATTREETADMVSITGDLQVKSSLSKTKPLTNKHLLGYAFGDWGGCMTFAIMGSFLLPYYTTIAGFSAVQVSLMFLLIKIWDAINDPMMGAIMDQLFARNKSDQKFRPYLRIAAPIMALSAIAMFNIPTGINPAARLVFAYVTYLLYEASYTMFNIPYGSLMSAMAETETERAQLSSARGFGSVIGNVLPMIIFPVIIDFFSNTNPQRGYMIGITTCAVIGFVLCIASYKMTEERRKVESEAAEGIKITDILAVFKKNRAFLGISLSAMAFMFVQTIVGGLGIYYFQDVLGNLSMMSLYTVATMGGSVISLIVGPKLISKFGQEKTIQGSLIIGAIIATAVLLLPTNAWVYILGMGSAMAFIGFPVLMQWGMIAEAIDYNEYLTDKRTEGSIYGTFNLTRRFGQAIGASGSAAILGIIGYNTAAGATQSVEVLRNIELLSIGLPILGAIVMFIAIRYVWNITPELRQEMAEKQVAKISSK